MGRPQKSVVYAANATPLGDMAQPLRDAADKMLESSDRVRNTVYDFEWEGEAKDAAEGRVDRELVQDRAVGAAEYALADAYENGAKTMQPMIDSLKSKGQGLEADDFAVSEDWVVTDTYDYDTGRKLAPLFGLSTSDVDAIQTQRANTATTETVNLQRLADELGVADENTTKAINEAKASLADSTGTPVGGDSSSPLDPNSERARNQREAFNKVYGRDPVSANDWRMAAALDPHSYLPKDHGVPAEIVAARFTPQPGKGVVRTNLFIPAESVWNTGKDLTDLERMRLFPKNFGDNRGPSAIADAEASRVSLFVDYDHGIVVVRQNPTATVDGQRGGAAAAVPKVHVVQAPDGRMTIDYNAHDSYEMPIATDSRMTVNGRVTLSPQSDGTVALGGSTTIYPSMETYQYREGLPVAQLQWDTANSGSAYGPGTSLMRHHWVGDTTIPAVRPDMPGWKWELENAMPYNAVPFFDDPFVSHTTQLTDPFQGDIPTVGTGR